MTQTRTVHRSFSGGEMSPEMFGQIEDAKYNTGASLISNFLVRPQGPAENRPGFSYVNHCKFSSRPCRLLPFTFSTDQTMVLELGHRYIRFHTFGQTLLNDSDEPYEIATTYNEDDINLLDIHHVQSADILTLTHPNHPPAEVRRLGATDWEINDISFTPQVSAPTGLTVVATQDGADKYEYKYVVTAFAEDGISESEQSAEVADMGNLLETGGIVDISWNTVANATKYRVYKLQGGIYGYIGETDTLSIVDDNIAPDLSISPPSYEQVFDGEDDYPGAVSYFEQRRVFAGTNNEPQNIWMTKSGTESDMSSSLPVRDDDRIKFRVAAREANKILHVVPITDLLLFTSAVEWRVTSVNSDAITPTTISVRPQSFIGASNVQPVVINNSVVYGAARGGHLREMGYNFNAGGYITGDLCLRSAHLFDGFQLVQMAYSKAPDPIVWSVSTSGKLLGITYVPEQSIGAWHQHTTKGEFESCTVVAEGTEDHLYVVVKREIEGQTVRYIERLESRAVEKIEDSFFVDSGGSYDGRNTGTDTVKVTDSNGWDAGDLLIIQSSERIFDSSQDSNDVGDHIVITDDNGIEYTLTINEVRGLSKVLATCDKDIPESYDIEDDNGEITTIPTIRKKNVTNWSFARSTISNITWLEGETVNVLSDGSVHKQVVVKDGAVKLDRPGSVVHVGLPYVCDLKTLPVAVGLQDGSFGQGRMKKVNNTWIRVFQSSGIFVGPDDLTLVEAKIRQEEPYGSPPDLRTGEVRIELKNKWGNGGEILVRQVAPLPLTIVNMTHEISLG